MTNNPLHLAYISGCEIVRLEINPGICPEHLSKDDAGHVVFYIDQPIPNLHLFIESNYYDEQSQKLLTRPAKPNRVSRWDTSSCSWVWKPEHLMAAVRAARNPRLSMCDWTQMPDNQLTEQRRKEWQSYRQALRDITKTCTAITGLDDIDWPTEPQGE